MLCPHIRCMQPVRFLYTVFQDIAETGAFLRLSPFKGILRRHDQFVHKAEYIFFLHSVLRQDLTGNS